MQSDATDHSSLGSTRWSRSLSRFQEPDTARGFYELAITITPFVVAWFAVYLALYKELYWLYALLLAPAAGLMVRLFMIQHDCGHGSFFRNKHWNDWVGRVVGVVTLTPYDHWRRTHAMHHATSGDLDRRGFGDIDTLTVSEYAGRSRLGRLQYRLYRNPIVMFGLGPAYVFILRSRLPFGFMRKGWRPWVSTMATNAAIAGGAGLLIWTVGFWPFMLVHLPIILLGASAGVWLFFIQHQFDDTHWAKGEQWRMQDAALHGSSHYDLPAVLRWFTANIGVHHVHHLSSRIPSYRLPEVLRAIPELRDVGRLTLLQSLKCAPLALWDEGRQRLISFNEYARLARASAAAA